MILELDSGNTRIKWRLLEEDAGRSCAEGALLSQDLHREGEELAQRLREYTPSVARIRAANTAGPKVAALLDAWARRWWECPVEYAVVAERLGAVVNGYREPTQLGVDRWLAMLAAWQRCQQACCVCDCGSAVTLDCIASDGRHEGGYILPGLTMMRRSLGRDTYGVDGAVTPQEAHPHPGHSTAEAVQCGTLLGVAALLGAVRNTHQHPQAQPPVFFLTGGDAPVISPLLDFPLQTVPSLVLEGLHLALP